MRHKRYGVKEARNFKIVTEIHLGMSNIFVVKTKGQLNRTSVAVVFDVIITLHHHQG